LLITLLTIIRILNVAPPVTVFIIPGQLINKFLQISKLGRSF
jgi:hypothetical protein